MDLRNKTLLAIGITFACFFIIMTVISLPMTLRGLDHFEQQDSLSRVLQTKAMINGEISTLQSTSHDWSWWDDIDRYVQGRNPGFAAVNLNRQSMENLNAHLFVITDTNGTVVFSRLLTPDLTADAPLSEDMLRTILNNPSVTNLSGPKGGIAGILILPDGPMILASSPILPSSMEGPPHGTFIIGRYLQASTLSRIGEVTGSPVAIYADTDTALVLVDKAVLESRSGDSTIFIIPNNESTISGVIAFSGLDGKPVFVVSDLPREVYHAGFAVITEFFLLFALSAMGVAVVVSLVMDHTVLQPIERLSDRIKDYEKNPDTLNVPILTSHDELAGLEKTIITTHNNLAESEKRFRYIVETAQEGILVIDRDFIITYANDRLSSMLGYPPEEITGNRVTKFMPENELAFPDSQKPRHQQKHGEHFECRIRKNDNTFMGAIVSTTPIWVGSEYSGSFIMVTDITARKQTEEALQRASNKLSLLNAVTCNDIRNATFTLGAYLQMERDKGITVEKSRQYLDKKLELVSRITESLDFAKNYQGLGVKPPLWESVPRAFLFGLSHVDTSGISRKMEVKNLEIFVDPLLETVFFSLAENVFRHGGTATEISLWYKETPAGLTLVFEDNGVGVPEDLKERIFERKTDQKRGMGLFLVRGILGVTRMTIRETGEVGKGCRFEMAVPKGAYRFVMDQKR